MEQNPYLLKEQLNRIEFLLMDIKQVSSITNKIVRTSLYDEPKKPNAHKSSPTKGGKSK
jgi:hypothetical protein